MYRTRVFFSFRVRATVATSRVGDRAQPQAPGRAGSSAGPARSQEWQWAEWRGVQHEHPQQLEANHELIQ